MTLLFLTTLIIQQNVSVMKAIEKVRFVQEKSKGEFVTEGIWCIKENDNYIIDNIPMIAKRISLGDTVAVEYDENEKAFYFEDFVAVCGNTTVRLYFDNEKLIEPTRRALELFGCESEVLLQMKIAAVNIPKDIDYLPVKKYLDEGESKGKWQYEESCLEHEY